MVAILMSIFNFMMAHWGELVTGFFAVMGALGALLSALMALAIVIPGDHPDKEIQWLADLIAKISRK